MSQLRPKKKEYNYILPLMSFATYEFAVCDSCCLLFKKPAFLTVQPISKATCSHAKDSRNSRTLISSKHQHPRNTNSQLIEGADSP